MFVLWFNRGKPGKHAELLKRHSLMNLNWHGMNLRTAMGHPFSLHPFLQGICHLQGAISTGRHSFYVYVGKKGCSGDLLAVQYRYI